MKKSIEKNEKKISGINMSSKKKARISNEHKSKTQKHK
jgi:hypothetical protein